MTSRRKKDRMISRIFHMAEQFEEPLKDELRHLAYNYLQKRTTPEAADQRLRRFGMMLSRRVAR